MTDLIFWQRKRRKKEKSRFRRPGLVGAFLFHHQGLPCVGEKAISLISSHQLLRCSFFILGGKYMVSASFLFLRGLEDLR